VIALKGVGSSATTVPHVRGQINGFSFAARRRLLRLCAEVDRRECRLLPLFVTLTYPSVWPADPADWKRQLDRFFHRLKRGWPDAAAIWRLEFQRRGAPHFHLLVFGLEFLPATWVAAAWYEIVGSGDLKHLQAGTQVVRVKSWRGVM